MSFARPFRGLAAKMLFACALALGVVFAGAERAEAQAAGRVYNGSEVHVAPKIKNVAGAQKAIETNYPASLRSQGGRVELMFVIDPDGKVDAASIEIVNTTHPLFSDAAKKAIVKLEFTPGMVDGAPVRTMVKFPIVFAPQ